MVWYGMVWYGMVWYGMVWYGMVWYGTIYGGIVHSNQDLILCVKIGVYFEVYFLGTSWILITLVWYGSP